MKTILHNSYAFLNIFFFVSIIFGYAFSTDNIALSSTKSFTFSCNQTIVSPGGIFELGIFKPEYSSRDVHHWYLGIWFKKISQRTYVWVANRNTPLSNPVGTIRVYKSKLVLFDQSNTLVWSTDFIEESDEGSPIMAELLDDGNFVLKHANISEHRGMFLWQSFDFPTDTLLPGMKLGWENRRHSYNFIRSWQTVSDPSSGNYSYGIEFSVEFQEETQSKGIPTMYVWSNGKKLNRISPWIGVSAVGVPKNQPVVYFMFTLIENNEELTYSFQILGDSKKYISIMRLSSQGYLQHLMWNETSSFWDILWNSPTDECDIYEHCGPYSFCDMQRMCCCLRGFEPKNPKAWALQNTSDGCVRKRPLSCKREYNFFQLTNIKLPDTSKAVMARSIGFDECKQTCMNDCSCTAFTTLNQSRLSSCVIWTGELLDMKQYVAGEGHDLYIKQEKDMNLHHKN